ncbi:MAG: hypothetical protein AAGD25_23820 [Cyanobacteria bacterium P01_F01_bin.150]
MASRQEGTTAEENIMRLLMQAIQALLKDVAPVEPKRIWTLHKIVGNQIYFYKSNNFQRSANHRDLVVPIASGLIGKAIKKDEDVLIFKNASEEKGYIKGWEECQAELISLIRDSRNNIIGVINIESNFVNDFGWNKDSSDSESIGESGERDYLVRQLKQIFHITSNHMSLIFRNEDLAECEKSSIGLIQALSEASIVTRANLYEIISNLAHWLNDREKLLKIILYLTEPGDKNRYKRLIKIDLEIDNSILGREDVDAQDNLEAIGELDLEILNSDKIGLLFDQTSYRFSEKAIVEIFGNSFTNALLSGSENPGIYFLASEVRDEFGATSARYFAGVVLAESSINNFSLIQTYFEIIKNVTEKHLRYKINRYMSLQSSATIEIYKTIFQEDSLRFALNKITSQIAEETESKFCMIYLVTQEALNNSRSKFYLGGGGKGAVDFADIRFDQERSIVNYVLHNQNQFYHRDFYNCEQNTQRLNRELKKQGLESPEVYAFPLTVENVGSHLKIGVIVLFRENSNVISGTNRPNPDQVRLRLSDWTECLSDLLHKKHKQTDLILAKTFNKLTEILPGILQASDSNDNLLFNLQVKINRRIIPLWKDVVNPAIFIIYKEIGERIEIVDQNVLPSMGFEPPRFMSGQGLTGSVILNQEVYEPFIEDFEPFTEDLDYPADDMDSLPTPDRACKIFWDGILGNKRRMYYGRHVTWGNTNYILLVVGVRQSQFLPSLGYELSHDFTTVVGECLKDILDVSSE